MFAVGVDKRKKEERQRDDHLRDGSHRCDEVVQNPFGL
jgi:hypothetical protein